MTEYSRATLPPIERFEHVFGQRRPLGWIVFSMITLVSNLYLIWPSWPLTWPETIAGGVTLVFVCLSPLCLVAGVWIIFKELLRRQRGQLLPPLEQVEVVVDSSGTFHIYQGVTGHIAWYAILSVDEREGMYFLRVEKEGGIGSAVIAPWVFDQDERVHVFAVMDHYLPGWQKMKPV
jgi:hypothetical protein